MKKRNLITLLAVTGTSALFAVPCWGQFGQIFNPEPGMVQAGSTNLPPGQYVMTNLNNGMALFVLVNQNGQMMAQDPRLLQISIHNVQPQQAQQLLQQPQQSGGFGNILKQGLNSILQNGMPGQQ